MNLPLYKDCKPRKGNDFHAGLWYDRFFNRYDDEWKIPEGEKQEWVRTVSGQVGGEAAKTFAVRQHELVNAMGGKSRVFTTDWHFVTGLGNNHPVENGFAWHPTLGVPYLTGAAVKGLLRGWCEQWADMDKAKIRRWFGPSIDELQKEKADPAAGELIFFDAVPTGSVTLKADIMTPHYGKWYEEGGQGPKPDGSNVPADWHDPNPIPFLVVDRNQPFQFSVMKRPTEAAAGIDLDEVMGELVRALAWLGAGAKTAVGYGRMREDENAQSRIEEKKRERQEIERRRAEEREAEREIEKSGLAGLEKEVRLRAERDRWKEDKSAFIGGATEIVERLEEERDADARRRVAEFIGEILERHDKGILANPDKRKGKKQRPFYKKTSIGLAKAILEHLKDD